MMNGWKQWIGIGLVCGLPSLAAAGGFDATRIGGSAKWVAHLDVARLRDSALGGVIMNQLYKEEATRKIEAFQTIFGFDPRKDIHSITLFGIDDQEANSALMMDASLDQEQLLTLVRANDDYTSSTYQDRVVHGWVDREKGESEPTYGSFVNDSTLVVSKNRDAVREVLDALAGEGHNLAESGTFQDLPGESSTSLLVAAASLAGMGDARPQAAVIENASWLMLSLGEEGNKVVGSAVLGAADRETAEQIASVARGMIALAMLGRTENAALADLAEAALIEATDSQVLLQVSLDASEVIEHMESEIRKQQADAESAEESGESEASNEPGESDAAEQ